MGKCFHSSRVLSVFCGTKEKRQGITVVKQPLGRVPNRYDGLNGPEIVEGFIRSLNATTNLYLCNLLTGNAQSSTLRGLSVCGQHDALAMRRKGFDSLSLHMNKHRYCHNFSLLYNEAIEDITARDFNHNVSITFEDGSFKFFNGAFYVLVDRWYEIYTEHCGYHKFMLGSISIITGPEYKYRKVLPAYMPR